MSRFVKGNAIARRQLGMAFLEKEREKSNLILEANLLKAQGQHQTAADRFAQAARIEEQLSDVLDRQGLRQKFFMHRFSALSCWVQAGNVYQALVMGEALLARNDLPEPLRVTLQAYLQLLRVRLERWVLQFAPEALSPAT